MDFGPRPRSPPPSSTATMFAPPAGHHHLDLRSPPFALLALHSRTPPSDAVTLGPALLSHSTRPTGSISLLSDLLGPPLTLPSPYRSWRCLSCQLSSLRALEPRRLTIPPSRPLWPGIAATLSILIAPTPGRLHPRVMTVARLLLPSPRTTRHWQSSDGARSSRTAPGTAQPDRLSSGSKVEGRAYLSKRRRRRVLDVASTRSPRGSRTRIHLPSPSPMY